VLYLRLIILSVVGNVSVDSKVHLVRLRESQDQQTQFFFEVIIKVGCMYVFIGMSIYTYMNIYVSTVFLKNTLSIFVRGMISMYTIR
jgi:arabinogalactan endo-1,4-beta-galactosidase